MLLCLVYNVVVVVCGVRLFRKVRNLGAGSSAAASPDRVLSAGPVDRLPQMSIVLSRLLLYSLIEMLSTCCVLTADYSNTLAEGM